MTTKHTEVITQWVRTIDVSFLHRITIDYALTHQEYSIILRHLTNAGRDSRKKTLRSEYVRDQVGFLLNRVRVGYYSLSLDTRFDLLCHLLDDAQ